MIATTIINQVIKWVFKDIRNLIIAVLAILYLWLWFFSPNILDKKCPEPIIQNRIMTTTDTLIKYVPVPEIDTVLVPKIVTIYDTVFTDCDTNLRATEFERMDTNFIFFKIKSLSRGKLVNLDLNYKLKPQKQIFIKEKTIELQTILRHDNRFNISGGLLYQKDNLIPSILLNRTKWSVYFGYDINQTKEVDKYSFGVFYKFRIFGSE